MQRARIIHNLGWFFIGLMAASLPVSKSFFLIFMGGLTGLFVLDGISYEKYTGFNKKYIWWKKLIYVIPFYFYLFFKSIYDKFRELPFKKIFGIFCLFYLVHIAAAFYSDDLSRALDELFSKLPVVVIPLLFLSIKHITRKEKNIVLLLFVLSVLVSTLVSFYFFVTNCFDDIRQISPFIYHISFAIFVTFSVFILLYFIQHNIVRDTRYKALCLLIILWFVVYQLFILKSLTGIILLFAGFIMILLFPRFFGINIRAHLARLTVIGILIIVAGFLGYSVWKFYSVEPVVKDELEAKTSKGNIYHHDTEIGLLESSNYVYIYLAADELKEAWNERSDLDFDGKDGRGHKLRYTIIRYMTAKGLRKDAEGLEQLTEQDIKNIESGVANPVYLKRYSIYPRIYKTIWEFDVYRKTGDFIDKSFVQRLQSIKIGSDIAKNNFLLGVGQGDVIDKYNAKYDEFDFCVPEESRITGANQLLNFIVAFGILGFLIIACSIVYPAKLMGAFSNNLFVIFFVFLLLAMLGEDTLNFQTGLSFFTFFYSFFVFLKHANDQ